MAVHDSIGDFLTQIRNAYKANLSSCLVRHSVLKEKIALIFFKQGYLSSCKFLENSTGKWLSLQLKYVEGAPALCAVTRISKPGCRVYSASDSLPRVLNGMGVLVLSTSKGLLTGFEAKKMKVGGELICSVY